MEENQNSENNTIVEENETVIVKTDNGSITGQDKCPKCGATDISPNIKSGKLRCNFCRYEFELEKISGMETNLSALQGKKIASGASDIVADAADVVTLKCSSCGAEVVIDTASATQARCHWCRNTLSINNQMPNGSVPDVVLPFGIQKNVAREEIEKFVGKRKFFAHPKFRKEFTTENIMGVYFPYMLIDVNMHSNLIGEGEHQTRVYSVGSDENRETYYDADVYHVEREFDLTIDGLSIESNSNRLNSNSKTETNNIINSIMPFDIENCVKYNSNYLKGYTSERRDTNISDLEGIVNSQSKDIARYAANDSLKNYDRGVRWENEDYKINGQQWRAAYLPVWLYSYLQVKGDKKLLHYVAVNARTKETMGSVPIHMPKLLLVSFIVELLSIFATIKVEWDYSYVFLSFGVIFFIIMYSRYRNSGARHSYEKDTKTNLTNLRQVDNFIRSEKRLKNAYIVGANNKRLEGEKLKNKGFSSLTGENIQDSIINSVTSRSAIANVIKNNINKK